MLKYFDDIVGKDLGFETLSLLMLDFAIFMTPIAIPLAVLLSSLMTFGNLGEHFELTAVKSAGISLLRALYPIFIFVCALTFVAFLSNNYLVPKAALNAYSLLWDIKQKKPALDLKEGAFYNGIPEISIKVNKKNPDTGEIHNVIIYDHRNKDGNKQVVLADSGRMYTIANDSYLVLELFDGQFFVEGSANSKTVSAKTVSNKPESLSRASFKRNKLIFDLSSFDLSRTDKSLFASNRIMRNLDQLEGDMDSLDIDIKELRYKAFVDNRYFFNYLSDAELAFTDELIAYEMWKDSLAQIEEEAAKKQRELDSLENERVKEEVAKNIEQDKEIIKRPKSENKVSKRPAIDRIADVSIQKKNIGDPVRLGLDIEDQAEDVVEVDTIGEEGGVLTRADSLRIKRQREQRMKQLKKIKKSVAEFVADTVMETKVLRAAVNNVRQNKSKLKSHLTNTERNRSQFRTYDVQWHKIIANSFACMVMFLIGAPLGAIIKRGGLGIPVLISIVFFIIFYVFTMMGEKWAKQDFIEPWLGMWSANILLFPIGLFFLRQARNDARLFDADFYNVMIARFKDFVKKEKNDQDN